MIPQRDRELCAVAALTVLNRLPELRAHCHAALNVGATRQEVAEVIFQMVTYGGMPVVVEGLHTLKDVLVEPRRAPLVPNFARVKQAALDHRAMGASISGAGPSVFGWYERRADAERAAEAMRAAFAEAGLDSDTFVAPVDGPAAGLVDGEAGA